MAENEIKRPVAGNDLTTGDIRKKLLGFFFPILVGMLFQQLYSTVDAAIVGKFIGSAALAAVGAGSTVIIEMVIGFFVGLNSGATVRIAQRYGAADEEGLRRVLHTFITFSLIVGALITAALWIGTPYILRLLRQPEDIVEASTLYLRIYFTGSIPLLLYNLFQGTLQGVGDSKRPLRYLVFSCVMNIVLDLLFVAVLGWGVAGAAWASVLSMTACTVLAGIYLMRVNGPHRIRLSALCLDMKVLGNTLRIGIPSGLQGCMYSISNMIIQVGVNGFGTTFAAAWTATGKLDGFYWVTSNAFGVAICAFVGQCYGAGDYKRLKQAVQTCMKIALGTTIVFSTLLLLFSRPAYGLFLNDQPVIDNAVTLMRYFVPYYFMWSFIEVLTGTFRGVGDTMRPMVITMVGTCFFRIAWMIFVVPMFNTVFSLSIVYGISWALTGSALILYYFKSNWLNRR